MRGGTSCSPPPPGGWVPPHLKSSEGDFKGPFWEFGTGLSTAMDSCLTSPQAEAEGSEPDPLEAPGEPSGGGWGAWTQASQEPGGSPGGGWRGGAGGPGAWQGVISGQLEKRHLRGAESEMPGRDGPKKQQQKTGRKDSKEGKRAWARAQDYGQTSHMRWPPIPRPALARPNPKAHAQRSAGRRGEAAECLPPAQASEAGLVAGGQTSDYDTRPSGMTWG